MRRRWTSLSMMMDMDGFVCLIAPPKLPDSNAPARVPGRDLLEEIRTLAPRCNLVATRRGRTTVGPSGLSIDAAAKYVASFIDDRSTLAPRGRRPRPSGRKVS